MKHPIVLLLFILFTLPFAGYGQVTGFDPSQEQEPMLKKSNPFFRSTATIVLQSKTMSYQGLLSTSTGTPVPDGSYDLQFDLYDSSGAGASQWTETHSAVAVHRGTFSVILGSTSPLNADFNKKLYVEMKALGGPAGPSYPLTFSPRSELTSAPSSLAPWAPNGNDIYFNAGHVGIGTSTPGSNDFGTLKMLIADSNGLNSDIALQVAGGGYGIFNFGASRGTLSSPAASSNGDLMGGVLFRGHDGSSHQIGAAIFGYADSVPALGKMPGRLSFYTTNSNGVSRKTMALDRNGNLTVTGNVGIGTTSPISQLHVRGTSPVRIMGDLTTLAGYEYVDFMARNSPFSTDIGGMRIQRDSTTGNVNTMLFAAANGNSASEKMRINGNGNVGIGTTSPTQKLTVSGNICATGTIGACSDVRFKRDIVPLSSSLKSVLSLQGVHYRWKTEEFPDRNFSKDRQIGLIAQEVEKIYPEVVQTGTDGYKSIDYARLTPALIEAVKEQQKQIDELKALVKSLASGKKNGEGKSFGAVK